MSFLTHIHRDFFIFLFPFFHGSFFPFPDPPGIVKAKAKRQELTDLLNDVINELNAGSSQDKMLARAAKEHLQKLPPVKSAAQETVSSLTDKARHAMQAEVKRTPIKNR